MNPAEFRAWLLDRRRRPLVMGILNVTPDSFSDGGRFLRAEAAVEHGRHLLAEGADVLDIGGESTRPGSQPVSAQEQIERTQPVIRALRNERDIAVSIDTTSAQVAREAMKAGACMVNDVSAGRADAEMFSAVAGGGAAIILMHMLGEPSTMQVSPMYEDVTSEVVEFLRQRVAAAVSAGIATERVLVDPGIGFGKTLEHNLTLLRDLRHMGKLERPVVIGTSRKAFIGRLTAEAEAARRIFGTAGSVAWCVANGADMLRVHDVGPMVQVMRVVRAIEAGNAKEFLKE